MKKIYEEREPKLKEEVKEEEQEETAEWGALGIFILVVAGLILAGSVVAMLV